MIAFVEGKLDVKEPAFVVINTGGIGYHIYISLRTYSEIKDKPSCRLYTHFHVKEDIQSLYGFWDLAEKEIFLSLVSISGIGPNTAMVILSSLNPEELRRAITNEDVPTIQQVKGIGLKTAQRIVLELKDKMLKQVLTGDIVKSTTPSNTVRQEALSALVTLGLPKQMAEKNIETIMKREGADITVEELIRLALKSSK